MLQEAELRANTLPRWIPFVLLTACVIATVVVGSRTADATTYVGNNAYSHDRLPWQHGQLHLVTQGYNEGDHSVSHFQPYAVDFDMSSGTAVLAITDGYVCFDTTDTSAGLGFYVVE